MPTAFSEPDLFVRDRGKHSGPPVLLIHGQALDGELWDPLADRLSMSRRVLVPDLPGYGRSAPLSPFSFDGVRQALERVLVSRDIGEVDVVGYSLGTYHAIALTLAGRVRVRRLFLLGPLAGVDPEVRAMFEGYAAALRAGSIDLAEVFVPMALPAAWAAAHASEVEALKAAVRRAPSATLEAEWLAIARSEDLRPRLREIRIPTLVRCGTEERSTPLAWAEAIARAIPGARLEAVDGVGHVYLVQDPLATISSVERFLGLDGR